MVDIREAVEEVVSIMEFQVQLKKITIDTIIS